VAGVTTPGQWSVRPLDHEHQVGTDRVAAARSGTENFDR
jgi:hypothetical protein